MLFFSFNHVPSPWNSPHDIIFEKITYKLTDYYYSFPYIYLLTALLFSFLLPFLCVITSHVSSSYLPALLNEFLLNTCPFHGHLLLLSQP